MERFTTVMPLVLAKYHHGHSTFSLSDSLVILYCYEMPKCLQDFCVYFSHTPSSLKNCDECLLRPVLFVDSMHIFYSKVFYFETDKSWSKSVWQTIAVPSIFYQSIFNCTSQQYIIDTKMMRHMAICVS